MDATFPPSGTNERDSFVTFIAETRKDIQFLTAAIKELKASVEEMVDRFESDAQDFRDSISGLGELKNGNTVLGQRLTTSEVRITDLETWRATVKAWIAASAFFGTLAGSGITLLLSHFWKP